MANYWNDSTYVNPQNYKYCPKCGGELTVKLIEDTPRLQCKSCEYIFYQNPTPAVAGILVKDKEVLLVKRKYDPKAGDWCLPAGFLEFGESLTDGLIREVKEETNLDVKAGELFQVCNAMDDPRYHVVLVVYWAELLNGNLKPGDDAIEAKYFPLAELPKEIAFTCHMEALEKVKEIVLNES
jgi:8-oxo-dGTP diphosphatase